MAKKDKAVKEEVEEVVEEVVEEEAPIEEPVPEPTPEPEPVASEENYKLVQTAKGMMRRYTDGTMGPH